MYYTSEEIMQEVKKQERQVRTKEGLNGGSFMGDAITLDGWYWIELDRVKTKDALLGWVVHLLDKKWVTINHLRWITKIASEYHGYDPHGGI